MSGMLGSVPILIILLLAPTAQHRFGLSEPMPRTDGTLRLASYNVLNLFDHSDDPDLQGIYDDFGDDPGPTSRERCGDLARVIRAVDADVLALEEVESETALAWFRDTFLQDMRYDYIASRDVGYYRGVEQSLLSRYPISNVLTWPNADLTKVRRSGGGWDKIPAGTEKIRFQRSPLCATIRTPDGYELTLFILHHKAGYSRWHREAEALQIMDYVAGMSSREPNRNIAILGDFNAQPWERSMQVYFRRGMVDAMTLRNHDLEHGDASPLLQTHTSGRVIDFILLNHAAVAEMVNGSGFVLGTSAEEYDWRTEPTPAGYASDHYPLAIDLVPIEGGGSSVTAIPWPHSAMTEALSASPTRQAPAANSPSSSKESSSPGGYVASTRSQVFHSAGCGNAKRISTKNRLTYKTIAEAERDGKRPAGCCNPGS